jgi:hypothetical protein
MKGRIKAGQGTLIGNAGEHYVVAELLKRGVIAALAPRNAPAFDILAANLDKTIRIRVKTKSEEYDDWQWMAKKDGSIFRNLAEHSDFTVLVNLALDVHQLTYFIVPTPILNKWLTDDFEEWVRTPGVRGRPHDPGNKKRNLAYPRHRRQLSEYENNWDILWT